ncbi:hypothetical protein GMSM_33980 [Geomonas sp. Red276]
MKIRSLVAGTLFLLTVAAGSAVQAKPLPIDDHALGEITGQSGIAISASNLGFDMTAGTIYYRDADGIGPGSSAGFLSLCGVKLKGSADFASPLTIEVATVKDPNGVTRVAGLEMKISDMTLKIDTFYIDTIRLGSAPGIGGSLGSFGINNMTVHMTGGITILAD